MVAAPVRTRMHSCAFSLLALSLLIGCSRSPAPSSAAHTSFSLRIQPASTSISVVSAQQSALAAVQCEPLYCAAQQACKAGQFRRASELLAQLASSSHLSAAQAAIVQEQRALCLRDADLPQEGRKGKSGKAKAGKLQTARQLPATNHPSPIVSADCGPKALLLACERLGMKTTLPQLRQLAGTSKQGTSLAGQ